MKKCPRCGTQGRDGSRICKQCGSILVEAVRDVVASSPAATPAPPPPGPPASVPPAVELASPLAMPTSDWRCVTCGEHHLQRALVCWRCGTDAWGKEDPHFVKATLDASAGGAGAGVEPEAPLHPEEVPYRVVPQCERCRSRKVIPDLELAVHVAADPDALLFRGPTARLLADICGECGHVELRIKDAAALYRAHLETLAKKREAGR